MQAREANEEYLRTYGRRRTQEPPLAVCQRFLDTCVRQNASALVDAIGPLSVSFYRKTSRNRKSLSWPSGGL